MANLYTVLKDIQTHVAEGGILMRPANPGEDWFDPITGHHWPSQTCLRAVADKILVGRGDGLFEGFDQIYGAPI